MSVLIRGMEIPTSCRACLYSRTDIRNVDWCVLTEKDLPCECPIIPVPKHGRLVDADVLTELCRDMQSIEWNKHTAPYSWAYAYEDFENVILDAPTIVPAE